MLVDLHVHTKKCKSGDPETRNVSTALFSEKVRSAGVKVIGITNHNHFDFLQYSQLKNSVNDVCDVWPGVEFDVKQFNLNAGHIIVIVNPKYAQQFEQKVKIIVADQTPENFTISVDDLTSSFNEFDPVFIAHCFKPKSLGQDDLDYLIEHVYNKNRILKEPSNIVSIGVLNAYEQKCILGSDVRDWNEYEKCQFSDFKYNFEGFDNFLKLLDKNKPYLDDLLNSSSHVNVPVYGSFSSKEFPFIIPVYEDINIIFGDKGSGKTEILSSIKGYCLENSIPAVLLESYKKNDWFKAQLTSNPNAIYSSNLGLQSNMSKQLNEISDYSENEAIDLKSYVNFFETESNNKNKARLKVINTDKINRDISKIVETIKQEYETIKLLNETFSDFESFKIYKDDIDFLQFKKDIPTILEKIHRLYTEKWIENKAYKLIDNLIDSVNKYVADSTGTPSVPNSTGFYKFAHNRLSVKNSIEEVYAALKISPKTIKTTYLGSLGEKGDGNIKETAGFINLDNYASIDSKDLKNRKGDCKNFLDAIKSINNELFTSKLFEKTQNLKDVLETGSIKSLDDLIFDKKEFLLGSSNYSPSSGEIAILAMQYEVLKNEEDIKVFLFDEPELSLGNEYIESEIVPLIKRLANSKKTVVIATHNANIAVRTGAINSILKTVKNNVYETYVGSMYTNKLININNAEDIKLWNAESERCLEGGVPAFEERGYYYGKDN